MIRNTPLTKTAAALIVFILAQPAIASEPSPPSPTDNNTPPARVTELYELIPADNEIQRQSLQSLLADLDKNDIAHICRDLLPPGAGDDSRPRKALHAITWHVWSATGLHQRQAYTDALTAALQSDQPTPVKRFLLQQLQRAGDPSAVRTLLKLLPNPDLCVPVAQSLLAIGGSEATAALRDFLPRAMPPCNIGIINALGDLGDREALSLLIQETRRGDCQTRIAAYSALAKIGDRMIYNRFHDDIRRAIRTGDDCFKEPFVLAVVLRIGEGMLAVDDQSSATALFQGLLRDPPEKKRPTHIKCAALRGLARSSTERTIYEIVTAFSTDEPAYRATARDIALTLKGSETTDALVAAIPDAPPDVRVALIEILGQRGDVSAVPAVRNALSDNNQNVRLAALPALATLRQGKAVRTFVDFLVKAEGEERSACKNVLVNLKDRWPSAVIARLLPNEPADVRADLLDVLRDRMATTQVDVVFEQAHDQNPQVRLAAIRALEKIAGERAIFGVMSLLDIARNEDERQAVENALVATCRRASQPDARAVPILAALNPQNPQQYKSLLTVLGHLGGPNTLTVLEQAVEDPRADVREAAFRALLHWPDADAAPTILELAQQTDTLKYHVLAIRAYANVIANAEQMPDDQRLQAYQAGLHTARRIEEKKLLLSKLGQLPTRNTILALRPYLEANALTAETMAALLNIADSLLPHDWHLAEEALALLIDVPEYLQPRVDEVRAHVADVHGFLTDWLVAAPFTIAGKAGHEILNTPFPPEESAIAPIAYETMPRTDDPDRFWYLDLDRVARGPHRVGYLLTYLHCPDTRTATLELGSDDGIKAWLNGHLIHENNALRGCSPGQDRVEIELSPGTNELLLKVSNDGGGWGACARVRNTDDTPARGICATTSPQQVPVSNTNDDAP